MAIKRNYKLAKDDLIICRLIARIVTDNDLKMENGDSFPSRKPVNLSPYLLGARFPHGEIIKTIFKNTANRRRT